MTHAPLDVNAAQKRQGSTVNVLWLWSHKKRLTELHMAHSQSSPTNLQYVNFFFLQTSFKKALQQFAEQFLNGYTKRGYCFKLKLPENFTVELT